MTSPTAMICDRCGNPMNHHADKLVHEPGGDVVVEMHACPGCGAIASRPAPPAG
jgi:hypothetical protein